MELNRPFLVIQIPFNFLRSPLSEPKVSQKKKGPLPPASLLYSPGFSNLYHLLAKARIDNVSSNSHSPNFPSLGFLFRRYINLCLLYQKLHFFFNSTTHV